MPQSAYNQSCTVCAIFKDCNDVLYSLGYFKDVPLVMQQTSFIKELCQSTPQWTTGFLEPSPQHLQSCVSYMHFFLTDNKCNAAVIAIRR